MRLTILLILFFALACNSDKSKENKTVTTTAETKFDPVADSLDLAELSVPLDSQSLDIPHENKYPGIFPRIAFHISHNATGRTYIIPDSMGGQLVTFYLDHPRLSVLARNLVDEKLNPSDDDSTFALMSLVTTDDSVLRPFYRMCMDYILTISDGALSEIAAEYAYDYAVKFPAEFLDYYYSNKQLRSRWVDEISFSAADSGDSLITRNRISEKMTENCKNCDPITKRRIKRFTNELIESAQKQGIF